MADNGNAIELHNVSKSFSLPHEKNSSIKSALINLRKRKTYEKQQVLRDVSFEIKKGEFFGIVGRNGSGKSTLLKLLAGIYSTDEGNVVVNGKLTPFIELGVGFNPELTGRENVFLNGALLGFNRKDMEAMYDDIVAFAELGRFMDQKLKNYSSGMQVRLAFSIAIRARSDILLLDEVLAVGDENFQRKCYDYFAQLKRRKQTVVFISHDMGAVSAYCDRALLLNQGKIDLIGTTQEVVRRYTDLNFTDVNKKTTQKEEDDSKRALSDGNVQIDDVWVGDDKPEAAFRPGSELRVHIDFSAKNPVDDLVVGMILRDAQGRIVFATNTQEMHEKVRQVGAGSKSRATFTIPNIFTNGTYTVSCALANSDRSQVYARAEDFYSFVSAGWPKSLEHAIAHPDHSFSLQEV